MRIDRMEILLDVLQYAPDDEHFDMGTWFLPHKPNCGFAACAAGWLLQDPRVTKTGLELAWHHDFGSQKVPVFGNLNNYPALAAWFEVEEAIARWLFDPWAYDQIRSTIKPLDVADRVVALIALGDEATGSYPRGGDGHRESFDTEHSRISRELRDAARREYERNHPEETLSA